MSEPYKPDELELGATLEELGRVEELLGIELEDEIAAELELGATLEELGTTDELLGFELDDEAAAELELGATDELLGFELDDEATAELELGSWQTATIEPPINRQSAIVVCTQPIDSWHE